MESTINIKNSKEIFKFPIVVEEKNFSTRNLFRYSMSDGELFIFDDSLVKLDMNNIKHEHPTSVQIPPSKMWMVTLMFPEYCDETINQYFLDLYINICSTKIHILSKMINTSDVVATHVTKIVNGIRYYECVELMIPNIFDIIYSEEWGEVRRLCGESIGTNNLEGLLVCDFFPIQDDVIAVDYSGGYTTMNLSKTSNNLSFYLDFDSDFNIVPRLSFNSVYDGDFQLYMAETYGLNKLYEKYSIKTEIVLKDNNNIFRVINKEIYDNNDIYININKSELDLTWSDWVVGLNFLGTFSIFNEYDEPVLTIYSNELPVTLDKMAYLVSNEEKIELSKIDMNIYNLDIVNKIDKRIINVTNSGDDKSNIINNIFILSNKIDDLIIHPQVTQNILLPLNGYKNKVNTLYLQVEGVIFSEIGRNQQGVIFKVDGHLLPNKDVQGSYYILDDNKELVTTGNYTYR